MIGKIIKELRTEKGVTQKELSDYLGLTPKMVSFYENEERFPPQDILNKLADYFSTTVDYILGRSKIRELPSNDVTELLETLHKRPEMKALFSLSKNATKEDIEKTMKIIEALKNESR
ncbi:MAG: helix-turn-helix transcriptional regulator [Desulfitobacteriaceae bacterium]|nr:helix-turn-helix transcriptional regulator [Desulfitobacteriaceae bacterium]